MPRRAVDSPAPVVDDAKPAIGVPQAEALVDTSLLMTHFVALARG